MNVDLRDQLRELCAVMEDEQGPLTVDYVRSRSDAVIVSQRSISSPPSEISLIDEALDQSGSLVAPVDTAADSVDAEGDVQRGDDLSVEYLQRHPGENTAISEQKLWFRVVTVAAAAVLLVVGVVVVTDTNSDNVVIDEHGAGVPGADADTAAQGEDAAGSASGSLLAHYWQGPLGPVSESGDVVGDGRIEMSDQRLTGDVTFTFIGDLWDPAGSEGDETFYLYWGTMAIKNDGGTWEGTHFAADHHSRPGVHGPIVMQLVGSGDYEGLSAILYRTVVSDPGDPIEESVDGMIFPGDLPPDRT